MISNASPLIICAKIDILNELIGLYKSIEISEEVYNEVIGKGLEKNREDAIILHSMWKEKKIVIIKLQEKYKKVSNKIIKEYNLDRGEAETIALALQLHRTEVLMDESMGRKVTRLFNIRSCGTLRVLLELYRKKSINEGRLRVKVNEIIGKQFRLDAEVMARFWELFEKMKNTKKE